MAAVGDRLLDQLGAGGLSSISTCSLTEPRLGAGLKKDCGFLTSGWELYKAEIALVAVFGRHDAGRASFMGAAGRSAVAAVA